MKTPQIALIGTEGSGKTVLTTVLAKKLETPQNGVWLDPQGTKTGKYIATTWNTLRSGEWVPSTPAGTLFTLKWKMQVGDRECPMRMIDSAGQDLRRLFSDDGFDDPNLADQDRQFIQYIHDSTILLILVNLRDFLGEADKNKVIENGFTLKGVLDKLKEDKEKRQIAFVFTAYDLYEESIKKKYGTCEKFIEKELSYLHNAYVAGQQVKCFPVAAVAETEIKASSDGFSSRVPALNFSSTGLDPLIQWLAAAVAAAAEEQEEELEGPKKPGVLKTIGTILIEGVIGLIAVLIIGACIGYVYAPPAPVIEDWSWDYQCLGVLCPFTGDHTVKADFLVKNKGGGGDIKVICTVGNATDYNTVYLKRNESAWVSVTVKPDRHDYKKASPQLTTIP